VNFELACKLSLFVKQGSATVEPLAAYRAHDQYELYDLPSESADDHRQ